MRCDGSLEGCRGFCRGYTPTTPQGGFTPFETPKESVNNEPAFGADGRSDTGSVAVFDLIWPQVWMWLGKDSGFGFRLETCGVDD